MGDNNLINGEANVNEMNYKGENHQQNQFIDDNPNTRSDEFFYHAPLNGMPDGGNVPRANRRYSNQDANSRINRVPFQPNMMNKRPYGMENNNAVYPAYDERYQNYSDKGVNKMNYPREYQSGDGRYMTYPHPHYHHEQDCDYYYYNRYNNRGPKAAMRPRQMYPNPPMEGYDPDCYQEMPQSSWLSQNMLSNFINKPRVNDFFRGVGIATVGLILAPTVAKTLRPLLVKTVQGAMTASEELKSVFVDAKEEVEDIFAEAKWESNHNESCGHKEDSSTGE